MCSIEPDVTFTQVVHCPLCHSFPFCYKIPVAVYWQKIYYIVKNISFVQNFIMDAFWVFIIQCEKNNYQTFY